MTDLEVVQCRFDPLRDYNMYCEACSSLALPPSFLASALEPFRYQYRRSDCFACPFLYKYDPCEDIRV